MDENRRVVLSKTPTHEKLAAARRLGGATVLDKVTAMLREIGEHVQALNDGIDAEEYGRALVAHAEHFAGSVIAGTPLAGSAEQQQLRERLAQQAEADLAGKPREPVTFSAAPKEGTGRQGLTTSKSLKDAGPTTPASPPLHPSEGDVWTNPQGQELVYRLGAWVLAD